jgi:hypothetical protein
MNFLSIKTHPLTVFLNPTISQHAKNWIIFSMLGEDQTGPENGNKLWRSVKFSYPVVAQQYQQIYRMVIEGK